MYGLPPLFFAAAECGRGEPGCRAPPSCWPPRGSARLVLALGGDSGDSGSPREAPAPSVCEEAASSCRHVDAGHVDETGRGESRSIRSRPGRARVQGVLEASARTMAVLVTEARSLSRGGDRGVRGRKSDVSTRSPPVAMGPPARGVKRCAEVATTNALCSFFRAGGGVFGLSYRESYSGTERELRGWPPAGEGEPGPSRACLFPLVASMASAVAPAAVAAVDAFGSRCITGRALAGRVGAP